MPVSQRGQGVLRVPGRRLSEKRTGFAAAVRAELAHLWPEKPCCLQAELAGILAFGGHWEQAGGELRFATSQAAVARLVYRLLKAAIRVSSQVVARRRTFQLVVGFSPGLWRWMHARPGLVDRHRRLVRRQWSRYGLAATCCRRAFLRGAFLAAGSVNNPRLGYHLEILLPSEEWGSTLGEMLAGFGLKPGLCHRRGLPLLYFKEGEQIAQFLNIIGAHAAYLEFESARVMKEVRGRVNRLVNCDTANLNRTVEAGLRQAALIARLKEEGSFGHLPANLRELAELRLAHPEASLRELGQMLTPRLGKTAVRYRLKRLEELAEEGAKNKPGDTDCGPK
ncbi:MAG: DNA-binding protein WhiA [Moorellales bacterium]